MELFSLLQVCFKGAVLYHLIIYEEDNTGYLLAKYQVRLQALELYKCILDDFAENDYLFSDEDFDINNYLIQTTYPILTHKIKIVTDKQFFIHKSIELKNGYLYHIHAQTEVLDMKSLPRDNTAMITVVSDGLNNDLEISLN